MPVIDWANAPADGLRRWTSWSNVYSDGHTVPAGVTMANGENGVMILQVYAHLAGNGAGRTVSIDFGPMNTGNFSVGSGSGPVSTGWKDVTDTYLSPGTYRMKVNTSGGVWYGRTNSGTNVTGGSSYGGRLSGGIHYATAPSAPRNFRGNNGSTPGTVDLYWDAPASDGESAITGYNVYRGSTLVGKYGVGGGVTVTQTPGTTQTYTVRARNRVTDARSTDSVNSNSATVTASGVPTAPRNLAGVPHPTIVNATRFRWDTPSDTAGGITRYLVYRDTALIHSGITQANIDDPNWWFVDTGLGIGREYKYDVRAQNSAGVSSGVRSEKSNDIFLVASELPGAPRNLTATLPATSGAVQLSWQAPLSDGTSMITGYEIRTSPTGAIVASTTGTGTTYTVTGLAPGATYTYIVRAKTSLSTAANSTTPWSNTVSASPVGEPGAPTGVVVAADSRVVGRLKVSWAVVPGPTTGYRVYEDGVMVADLPASVTAYTFDNLPARVHNYTIRARNVTTDESGTIGPASASKAGTPATYATQTLADQNTTVANESVAGFIGTRVITGVSARTFTFTSTGPNVASAAIGAGSGLTTNSTNQSINGTYTAIVGGFPDIEQTLRFNKSVTPFTQTNVPSGTITNNTNSVMDGAATITSSDALYKTFTYSRAIANVPARLTLGTVTNLSNAVYNITDATILTASNNRITYAKTNANLPLSGASGMVTNTTVRDYYNGTHRISGTESYKDFTFASSFETGSDETVVKNIAVDQTMTTTGALAHWKPTAGTSIIGSPGEARLTRTTAGTARVEFPAYPDGSVYMTDGLNYTAGFSVRLLNAAANLEVPIRVFVEYLDADGQAVRTAQTLPTFRITEDEQQVQWTVPGTQNGPRSVVVYMTGLTAVQDTVVITKPFLVATPDDTLPFEGPYFDGNSTDTAKVSYSWTSQPNSSSRTLLSTPTYPYETSTPAFSGAASTYSLGSLKVKYRSGWIG